MKVKSRLVLCLVTALAVAVLCGPSAVQGVQDKSKGEDVKIEGKLTDADPKDKVRTNSVHKVHTVKLVEGRTYAIDLISADFDAYLRLEDSTGKQLASDDDGGDGNNARILFSSPKDDTYRIIATSYVGGTGSYTLRVRQQRAAAAVPLPLKDGSGQVDGQLTKDDPKDTVRKVSSAKVYAIDLKSGKEYQIDLISKEPAGEFDTYLRLEDATGKQLAADDDSGKVGNDLNARILFKCPSDGTYRIVATSFFGGVGKYTLSVQQK